MIGPGHFHPAEGTSGLTDSVIISRDDDLFQNPRGGAALNHVLDERFAGDESQRFPRKPGGSKAGRNDANHIHGPEFYQPGLRIARSKEPEMQPVGDRGAKTSGCRGPEFCKFRDESDAEIGVGAWEARKAPI